MAKETGIRFKYPERFIRLWGESPVETHKQLRIGLKQIGRDVAAYARTHHRFKSKTGKLEQDIKWEYITRPMGVLVGIPSNHPYGHFVHSGTRPHWIEAKNKKALTWAGSGNASNPRGFWKRVWHPGTRPDPFIINAFKKQRKHIDFLLEESLRRAYKNLGLS